ncbi:MAG TPA: ATP-dependent zinc metalloprotease FtsH [Candidatus Kapabacteria bacterium]|nr:ATP-dependent zinc metalloprotease FtsH [Candidatus Kapabacteria bacterium]
MNQEQTNDNREKKPVGEKPVSPNKAKRRPPTRRPAKQRDEDAAISRTFRTFVMWISLVAGVLLIVLLLKQNEATEATVSYTAYLQYLDNGEIESARVTKSDNNSYDFHGTLRSMETLRRSDGSDEKFTHFVTKLEFLDATTEKTWHDKSISFTYDDSGNTWIGTYLIQMLPWIGLIFIAVFIMRRMQQSGGGPKGIFSFGKSRAKVWTEGGPRVTFLDVAGNDEAKEELVEIIEFLREPTKFQRLGGKIPKGVLMLGPPGTGKTLLARAVAGEAGVPFFSISGADFVEMFVGVGASRVRDLFEQAKRSGPCIIFIDEIDAVGRQRGAGLGGGHDEREQTLNQLLVEMDGFEQNVGIILIAATNRPDVLDPALLRPGRFDRQIVVDRPDMRGREAILKVHARAIPIAADVSFETIARVTPGMSGADLANLVNEAALIAARQNYSSVHMRHFEEAKDKVMMGAERRSMVIPEEEKRKTAYHEIGHVLASKFTPGSDPIHKVTIIPRGRALGVTSYLPFDDKHSYALEYVKGRIVSLMGGRTAELLIYNELSTGAQDDIQRATELAHRMVCEWGMSKKLGPISFGDREEEIFLGREITKHKNYSEQTAQDIDSEISAIINECSGKAETILKENIETLHKLAKALVERETLDSDEIDKIIRGEELPPFEKRQNDSSTKKS